MHISRLAFAKQIKHTKWSFSPYCQTHVKTSVFKVQGSNQRIDSLAQLSKGVYVLITHGRCALTETYLYCFVRKSFKTRTTNVTTSSKTTPNCSFTVQKLVNYTHTCTTKSF